MPAMLEHDRPSVAGNEHQLRVVDQEALTVSHLQEERPEGLGPLRLVNLFMVHHDFSGIWATDSDRSSPGPNRNCPIAAQNPERRGTVERGAMLGADGEHRPRLIARSCWVNCAQLLAVNRSWLLADPRVRGDLEAEADVRE